MLLKLFYTLIFFTISIKASGQRIDCLQDDNGQMVCGIPEPSLNICESQIVENLAKSNLTLDDIERVYFNRVRQSYKPECPLDSGCFHVVIEAENSTNSQNLNLTYFQSNNDLLAFFDRSDEFFDFSLRSIERSRTLELLGADTPDRRTQVNQKYDSKVQDAREVLTNVRKVHCGVDEHQTAP